MLETNLMIEGQHGLNWDRWKRVVRTAEEVGFDGLFRSDHFYNPEGQPRDSLELWVSLTWLADNTDNLEFGPLVTPLSFRDPVFTARMGKDVDDLSDGRFTLGVGAGWQEREHDSFGYDLLSIPERLDRFEEGVEIIERLLRADAPVSFEGEYYELNEAQLLPGPDRPTPILVGGNGRDRTMPLAAEYADEWNGTFLRPDEFEDRNDHLDELLEARGRDPDDVDRSIMTRVVFGDDDEVERILDEDPLFGGSDAEDLREFGVIVGTGTEIADHLDRLADAGADRVMLQWLELDELDRLEAMADEIL